MNIKCSIKEEKTLFIYVFKEYKIIAAGKKKQNQPKKIFFHKNISR